jgi:hypothetical protein
VAPLSNVIKRSIYTKNTFPNKEGSMVVHNTIPQNMKKHHKNQKFRICARKTPRKNKIAHQIKHPKFVK